MATRRTRETVVTIGGVLCVALAGAAAWRFSGEPDAPTASATPTEAPPADAGAPSFIAFARDFAAFRTWARLPVDGAMMPIDAAPGPTFVYASARAPAGARRWPVGTILVKAIESGAPDAWTVHAMVKRGVPYNADGAIGWEFFELRLAAITGEPSIVWRGPGPPSGHGYAAAGRDAGTDPIPLVCNDCHAAAWLNDAALTPALALVP